MRYTVMDRNGKIHASHPFESELTKEELKEDLLRSGRINVQLGEERYRVIFDPVWIDVED